MAIDYQETDTNATGHTADSAYCAAADSLSGWYTSLSVRAATVGGTAGTTAVAHANINADITRVTMPREIVPESGVTWSAGTITVNHEVSTANSNLTLDGGYACRLSSSNVSQASIGSRTDAAISLGSLGVKTYTISGAVQTPDAGDKVFVMMRVSSAAMNSAHQYKPSQLLTLPFTEASAPTETEGSSAGAATVTGVGAAIATTVGSAVGFATPTGVGAAIALTVASATGLAVVTGVGEDAAAGTVEETDGTSVGFATTAGIGASTNLTTASAAGSAATTGVGAWYVLVVGASEGSATTTGVSGNILATDGSSAGSAVTTGVAFSTNGSVGSSTGTAVVSGVGALTALTTGTSAGAATVTGRTEDAGEGGIGDSNGFGCWEIDIPAIVDGDDSRN